MAKETLKEKTKSFASMFSRNIEDIRTGIDEGSKDIDRINMAKFARILGFVILLSGILYLISFLQTINLI